LRYWGSEAASKKHSRLARSCFKGADMVKLLGLKKFRA
jgi:hypothetical protein